MKFPESKIINISIAGCLVLLIAGMLSCRQAPDQSNPRKNVLFIMIDDLTTDLGSYGNSVVKSPNIDRLDENGIQFTQAYTQFPLCNPSRASLLTGMYPGKVGVKNLSDGLRDNIPDLVTLPQLFRENGYFTARAGKIFHMGVPDDIAVCSSGADDPRSWDITHNCKGFELNTNGVFYNATPYEEDTVGTGGAISWLKAKKHDSLQHDYNVATRTIELIREHKDEPFFIAPGFIRPHVPLVAPERFFAMYDTADITLPPAHPDDRADIPEIVLDYFASDYDITKNEHKRAIRAYYASITFVDEQVGRILEVLEEEGLRENTIVALVSDHGFQLGEHGLWFKNYLYEESNRSPLIIHDPTQSGGVQQYDGLVEFVDIYPTIAELAGLPYHDRVQGRSLLPLFKNEEIDEIEYVKIETKHGRSIRSKEWVYNRYHSGTEEIFNLREDPHEFNNLMDDDISPEIKNELRNEWKEAFNGFDNER
ncbi:sulfatase [Halalkalibaculum sp. DA3122]|uniref:sulfatase n=1 Tax=Halalkalibaculum sp. DA3122 TaxID=3373607 RepID=UPI003754E999